MAQEFYTDRTRGPVSRTHEELPEHTYEGLRSLVRRKITSNWLAEQFPEQCPDGRGVAGTDGWALGYDLAAMVPGVNWPLWQDTVNDDTLFDVIEYVARRVSKPSDGPPHDWFGHHELNFDVKAGRATFTDEVNGILTRGGTVYQLTGDAQIRRVGSPELRTALRALRPATGDQTLDTLIEDGRRRYLSRKDSERVTAVEKLWDAFERLKTIDIPGDKNKKASVQALLGYITDVPVRALAEAEAFALTDIGNTFQIRHHETGKHPVPANARDYIAGRMINLLTLLLRASNRLVTD